MSLGSEYRTEMEVESAIRYENEVRMVRQGIWKDRWGNERRVSDMSSQHIRNCLGILEKRDDEISFLWKKRFQDELEMREGNGCSILGTSRN